MVPGEQQERVIGIVDYGMGNLRSVYNAFRSFDANVKLLTEEQHFEGVTHLVIPGVGSFARAMDNLNKRQLIKPIKDIAASGKPLLGICLGMQLLATYGYEPYKTEGLGIIEGEVVRMDFPGVRIPHVGWNSLQLTSEHALFQGVKRQADFYFVHSFYFRPNNEGNVLARSQYGEEFASVVYSGNIVGMQFHPEKSQKHGLRILDNFCNS
jgi:imidazole glycerol-phosphate synthase subunit HisH